MTQNEYDQLQEIRRYLMDASVSAERMKCAEARVVEEALDQIRHYIFSLKEPPRRNRGFRR